MGPDNLMRTLSVASTRILRPLVRILLRSGVSYDAFAEIAKRAYVDVAKSEFAIPGKKQTTSRISTITGLSRKEVVRVANVPDVSEALKEAGINRAARVISGWIRGEAYHDERGQPGDLPFEGEKGSFTALVKQFSGDITARTIADELARVGAITVTPKGNIRLTSRAYIPHQNDIEKLEILGSDVADLISTIAHNLVCPPERRLFQRKAVYNNLPAESMPDLQIKLSAKAQSCLEAMSDTLAKSDRDANPKIKGTGHFRAGVGIYYFEEEIND